MKEGDKQYVVKEDFLVPGTAVFRVHLLECKLKEERTLVATCDSSQDALEIVRALNEAHGY